MNLPSLKREMSQFQRSILPILTVLGICLGGCGTEEKSQTALSTPPDSQSAESSTTAASDQSTAPKVPLPRSYDGIALGMSFAQVKRIFPDVTGDIIFGENGPAYNAYKDSNNPTYKTYTADGGGSGFIFLRGCLVGYFTTKDGDYPKLAEQMAKKYGWAGESKTLDNGSHEYTWNDGKTEINIQDLLSQGYWLDAVDYEELASDFESHRGHLVSNSVAKHAWQVYDGAEYVPGYVSTEDRDQFLASQSPEGKAAQKKLWASNRVVKLLPGTKLQKIKEHPDSGMVQAKILSGHYRGQVKWLESAFIDRTDQ
jgi:hypothetical protein